MQVSLGTLLLVAVVAVACSRATAVPQEFHALELSPSHLYNHRLPKSVQPVKYTVDLDLSHAFDGRHGPHFFSGSVTIDVTFYAARRRCGLEKCATRLFDQYVGKCVGKEPYEQCPFEGAPNEIVMHADESVQISDVEVLKEGGKQLKIKKMGRDKEHQMLVFQMAKDLPRDGLKGQIRFNFSAPIRGDNRGVYYSTDTSNKRNFRHVVAKFQPNFARLAMPCFDEPGFKAAFELHLKHGSSVTAYANTEIEGRHPAEESGAVKSVFESTPRMPIHMVAFVVGDLEQKPLTVQVRPGLTLRYLSVPGLSQKGEFALGVARKAIAWFEQYIDYKYPLSKLDVVAISDTDTDTTETWGLVFLRDHLVAHDEETQQFSRISTAVSVAHVVVHQWFANLVTAKWWDDLWITESVAAQMAFEFVAELYPDYESEYALRISALSSALTEDASGKQHSLCPPENKLSDPAKVQEIFDQLTFMKSGALARSLQDLLGEHQYQQTLKLLVASFAHENFGFADLLECIEQTAESQVDIIITRRMLHSFSAFQGFPVLNVEVGGFLVHEDGHLIVYTEPVDEARPAVDQSILLDYGYGDEASEHPWLTPLQALVFDDLGERREVVPVKFGATTIALAELPEWFDPEKHYLKLQPRPDYSTYYRIRYSDDLLRQLKGLIAQKQLTPLDRVQLLDDANALVKLQLISEDSFRELFDSYANEDSFPVIWAMVKAAQTLSQLTETSTAQPASLQVFQRLFRDYGFKASGKETLMEQRARSETLMALVAQGDQQVVEEALKAFEAGNVALFLRAPVYAAVVKAGSKAQIEQLVHHLEKTDSYEEKSRLAGALALSTDKEVLNQLVQFLNERSGSKRATLKTLEHSDSSLSIDHGVAAIKE